MYIYYVKHLIVCLRCFFSILLDKAIEENRVLSVVELVKCCPFETIEVSSPNTLRDLSIIEATKNRESCDLKKFYDVALSILSAFLEVISKRRSTTKLNSLNLGSVPANKCMLQLLTDFVHKNRPVKAPQNTNNVLKCNPKDIKRLREGSKLLSHDLQCDQKQTDSQEYVLKCSYLVEECQELIDICRSYLLARKFSFHLRMTGMCLHNCVLPSCLISDFPKVVDMQDFQMLSFSFSDFNPFPKLLFSELRNFRSLKYLNMSNMKNPFGHDDTDLLREFSVSLTTFISLKRLVLRSIKLTGCLSYIFCTFCKKKSDPSITTPCCLGHCGSLEYLDLSGCRLKGEDIAFFKDLPAFRSLKYLDISDNSLSVTSTLQTLLCMSSSLVLLNMENCFMQPPEYNSETFPLSVFTQIRFLNIKGILVADRRMLLSELEKMTFELIKTDDEPPFDTLSFMSNSQTFLLTRPDLS